MDIENIQDSSRVIKRRASKKFPASYGIRDAYAYYKKEIPAEKRVSEKLFKQINTDLWKLVQKKILEESQSVYLPGALGRLWIRKKRMSFAQRSRIPINWKASKQVGKKVYHLNEHRDYHIYKYAWGRFGKVVNISHYVFRAPRDYCRKLSFILQNKPEIDYYTYEFTN